MQTYIFTPGDMVVRKGEIAREMFIIADGHLDVIGSKGKMIARISTGNFFGEIGILNLDGGINRYVLYMSVIRLLYCKLVWSIFRTKCTGTC